VIATLRREYTFEAAHLLPHVPAGHKCGRMHGHSYRVTVLVRGPVDPVAGWVCDFAEIDWMVRPIIARLDHSTLNDTLPNPTSEMLCAWLLRELAAVPHLYAVEVCETERSACMVTVNDLGGAA
jgi:6-pyruvoyltetrahydropterin/6-carboxytetrahydropterin synthase